MSRRSSNAHETRSRCSRRGARGRPAAFAGAAGGGIALLLPREALGDAVRRHVSITVEGGNRPALRALLGSSVAQTFTYGDNTEFLQWTNGVPKVVQAGDLTAGDYVRVNVRAPRGSSLATIESTAAGLDRRPRHPLDRPDKPDYLFRGTVASVGSSSVSVDVRGGNRRALRLLLGSSATQTFTVGDSTIFLLWQGKVPTVTQLARPEGRRQGRDPRPRPGRLDAGPGRGDAGGQGGRARAGIERTVSNAGLETPTARSNRRAATSGPAAFYLLLTPNPKSSRSCEHVTPPLRRPARRPRRRERLLLGRPGFVRAAAGDDRPLLRATDDPRGGDPPGAGRGRERLPARPGRDQGRDAGPIDLRERDGSTVTIPVARRARVAGSPSVTNVAQLRPRAARPRGAQGQRPRQPDPGRSRRVDRGEEGDRQRAHARRGRRRDRPPRQAVPRAAGGLARPLAPDRRGGRRRAPPSPRAARRARRRPARHRRLRGLPPDPRASRTCRS